MSIDNLVKETKSALDSITNRMSQMQADITAVAQKSAVNPAAGLSTKNVQKRLLTKSMKLAENHDPRALARTLKGIVTGNWNGCETEYKAMGTSNAAGGYTLPLAVSNQVIDFARAKSVCLDAGVRTLMLSEGTTRLPKVLTDPVGTWKQENEALIPTDITFDAVTLVPKTLAAVVTCSIELFEDSDLIDEIIVQTLMRSLAQQLDYAILRGNGSYTPKGIRFTEGVTVIGEDFGAGVPVSREMISNACQLIWEANGNPNAVIMSPREYGNLDRLVEEENGQPLNPFPSYNALSKHFTSAIPTNLETYGSPADTVASEVYVGDFSQALVGMRTDWTVEASRTARDAFDRLQVAVRIYGRFDVGVLQPNHFVVVENVVGEVEDEG